MRVSLLVTVSLLVLVAGCTAGLGTSDAGPEAVSTRAPVTSETGDAAPNGTLTVHFIDVGQSSSTLVVGPTNETMLVDSGSWLDDGEYVLAYLRRYDIDRIDYLVTSHADADHIGGHAAIIEYYETRADGVGAIYDPGLASASKTYERYLDAVEKYGVPLYRTHTGDSIPLTGARVRVLSPPADPIAGGDRNENSLVVELSFGATSFLFPGDSGPATDRYLVRTYGSALDTTVLQAAHHGSRTGTSATLLDATTPQAVVVSSAYDSQYGHPHRDVLERLAARSIPTYWTAVHGTVVVESTGPNVTVLAQRSATTDPLSLRDEPAVEPGATDEFVVVDRFAARAGTESSPFQDRLIVATIHADATGNDDDNLPDEYVVFRNGGEEPLDLSNWTIRDAAGHQYTIPDGVTLAPGATLTLRTGAGANTGVGTDGDVTLYWTANGAIWNNDGDTITVTNETGVTTLEVSY